MVSNPFFQNQTAAKWVMGTSLLFLHALLVFVLVGFGNPSPASAATPFSPTQSGGGNLAPPLTADTQEQTKFGGLSFSTGADLLLEPLALPHPPSTISAKQFCFANGDCIDSWTGGIFLRLQNDFNGRIEQTGSSSLKAYRGAGQEQEWALRGTAADPAAGEVTAGLKGIGSSSGAPSVSAGVYGWTTLSSDDRFSVLGKATGLSLAYAGYFRGRVGVGVDGTTKVHLAWPSGQPQGPGLVNVADGATVYTDAGRYLTIPVTAALSSLTAVGLPGLPLTIDANVDAPIQTGAHLTIAPTFGLTLGGVTVTNWNNAQQELWAEDGSYGTYLYPTHDTANRAILAGPFSVQVSGPDNAKVKVASTLPNGGAIKFDHYVVGDAAAGDPYTCGDGICQPQAGETCQNAGPTVCVADCGICPVTPPSIVPSAATDSDAFGRPVIALGAISRAGQNGYQGTKIQRYTIAAGENCATGAPPRDFFDASATIFNSDENSYFDYNVSFGIRYCYRLWTHNSVPQPRSAPSEIAITAADIPATDLTCIDGIDNSAKPSCEPGAVGGSCCYDYFFQDTLGCRSLTFDEPDESTACLSVSPSSCGNNICEEALGEFKRNCSDCPAIACQSELGLTPVCEQEEEGYDDGLPWTPNCPGDCMKFAP